MPITYQLKPDDRLVVLVHAGAVPDEEFLSFYKTLYKDQRFDKSFNLLVDLRRTQSATRSTAALQEFAGFLERQFGSVNGTPKVAVVAPEDVSFGLARMYEAFSSAVPWDFQVFRAAEEAMSWLGVSGSLLDAPAG